MILKLLPVRLPGRMTKDVRDMVNLVVLLKGIVSVR